MCALPKRSKKCKLSLYKSSSTSASFVCSNIDLLSKILLCLPIKFIITLKLVSKEWFSVISDYSFQRSMEKKCQILYSGLFMSRLSCLNDTFRESEYVFLDKDDTDRSVPFRTLVFGKCKESIKIEQSCNGLLLCSSKIPTNPWGRAYYVYNPYTEQYKHIPRRRGFDILARVSLAFNPSKSPFYKVISLWRRQSGHQIEIYSSQTSSLRKCGEKFQIQVRLPISPGVYWNGCLNWISDQGTLVYFEVEQEVIKHLRGTPYVIDGVKKKICYFDVCRGHLQMIVQDTTESHFDVLEMDTGYTGWNLKYHINLETGLRASYPELVVEERLKFRVMMYDGADTDGKGSPKLLLLIPSPTVHGDICLYDIKDMQFKRIHHNMEQPCILRERCGMMYVRLYHYMGSLARV